MPLLKMASRLRQGWTRMVRITALLRGRPVIAGCLMGLLLSFFLEAGHVLVGGNFHAVVAGKVYRCSQPSPEHLEHLIKDYGIRTVINLRGNCNPNSWYLEECRVTHRLDVNQEDVCFSAGRLPPVPEMRRLVEILEHSELPVLFHCQRGADRTGLASVVAALLLADVSYPEARIQLGLRYGHLALGRPANLDWFLDLYTEWLQKQGLQHSREVFRRWAEREYCPGPCWATLEFLEPPPVIPCHEPVALRVRAHNTSVKPWRFRPGSDAGIHVRYTVHDDQFQLAAPVGRSGLRVADVPPGGSIDLTLALPPLPEPGRYHLLVDLCDEQHCCFFQTGSEPLQCDLEVR
jgi:protein tyrosine phosphatase (PTP) superfamily phosphohydrolase (DUF442 family)